MTPDSPAQRLDKWLFHARLCKSRGVAAALVEQGRVRVNGQSVTKPARLIGPGDVLTLPFGGAIRVVRIIALDDRRGPAPAAQGLYMDIGPQPSAARVLE